MTIQRQPIKGLKTSLSFLCFLSITVFVFAVSDHAVKIENVSVRYLSPEELGAKSKTLVHARIDSIVPEKKGSMIYTVARCTVLDLMRGDPGGEKIEIRQPGGSIGNLRTWSGPMPKWDVGQEWIFALSKPLKKGWAVVGIKQGAFRVVGENAEREYDGFTFVAKPPASVVGGVETIPVAVLKQRMLGVLTDISVESPTEELHRDKVRGSSGLLQHSDARGDAVSGTPGQSSDTLEDRAINRLPRVIIMIILPMVIAVLVFFTRRERKS